MGYCIERNGEKIELTRSEMLDIYWAIDREYIREDVESIIDQRYDNLENDIEEIVDFCMDSIEFNDPIKDTVEELVWLFAYKNNKIEY